VKEHYDVVYGWPGDDERKTSQSNVSLPGIRGDVDDCMLTTIITVPAAVGENARYWYSGYVLGKEL
jgi:hypothetical protein